MSDSPFENIAFPHVPEPESYRQSLLTAFDNCAYSGALYVDGMVPGHPLYRGSVLHETVDRCIKTMTEHGHEQMAPDDVKAVLEETLADHPDWVVPAKELDGMRVQAHHWATHFRLPPGALSEVPYTLEVNGKTCTGTIDLLWEADGKLFIRDLKTGYNLYKQEEVSGKDAEAGVQRGARSAQLLQYALGVIDGKCEGFVLPRGVNAIDMAFVFPMFVWDDGMVERGLQITRAELIEHRTWLELLVKRTQHAFAEGKFTAVPGSHCGRCPNQRACPIPVSAKGTGPFEGDAAVAAAEWFRKKEEVAAEFEDLKMYAKEVGPILFGKDLVLDFTQVTTRRTPKKAKERVMAGEFVPPDELYVPSVSTRFEVKTR